MADFMHEERKGEENDVFLTPNRQKENITYPVRFSMECDDNRIKKIKVIYRYLAEKDNGKAAELENGNWIKLKDNLCRQDINSNKWDLLVAFEYPIFQYQYKAYLIDKTVKWEKGIIRRCDINQLNQKESKVDGYYCLSDKWNHTKIQLQLYFKPQTIQDYITLKYKTIPSSKEDQNNMMSMEYNEDEEYFYFDIDLDQSEEKLLSIQYEYRLYSFELNRYLSDLIGKRIINMKDIYSNVIKDFNFTPENSIQYNSEENRFEDSDDFDDQLNLGQHPRNDEIPFNQQNSRESDYLYKDYGVDSPVNKNNHSDYQQENYDNDQNYEDIDSAEDDKDNHEERKDIQNYRVSKIVEDTKIYPILNNGNLFIRELPRDQEEFSELSKLHINGLFIVDKNQKLVDSIYKLYWRQIFSQNKSLDTLVQDILKLNKKNKTVKKLVVSAIPKSNDIYQDEDDIYTKINFAATELKNMLLLDDLKVCLIYTKQNINSIAAVIIAYLYKYCSFVVEEGLFLMKEIDETIEVNITDIRLAVDT